MYRTTYFSPLLILTLLACPFKCMGMFEGESTEAAVKATCACCSQCSSEQDSVPQEPSQNSEDDCSCGNCLCNGAVYVPGDDSAQFAVLAYSTLDTPKPPLVPVASERYGVLDDSSPVIHDSGWMLRIAHQSFLL